MTETQKRLLWLTLLAGTLVIVSALAWRMQARPGSQIGTLKASSVQAKPTISPPEYTDTVAQKLAKSKGFDALISYTDNGFEPKDVTVKKGQTVRFTNNSKVALKIFSPAEVGDSPYPGKGECGSIMNSCADIASKDFWEFTFGEKGKWTFKDALHAEKQGSVEVR